MKQLKMDSQMYDAFGQLALKMDMNIDELVDSILRDWIEDRLKEVLSEKN